MREFLTTALALSLWVGFYVCVRIFFSSIKRSALKQQPHEDGAALEFYTVPRMRILVSVVTTLLVAFMVLSGIAMRREPNTYYGLLIPLSVLVLLLLVRPVSVTVDQNGIHQSRWFLRDKEIAWKDVASVAYGPNTGTTYVRSKNGGPKIRFSAFLVGRNRFKHEIRAHVHDADIFEDS